MPVPLYTGKFLALIKDGHWEYAHRVNASGAAIILALTAENKLLLVEQYRIPCQTITIELPAGIVGDEHGRADEPISQAARRELLEETGYDCEHLEPLTTGPSSGGLASELVTLFRATGLRRVGSGGGLPNEGIMVHEVPLTEVHDWLETKARAGVLVDPKVYAGLYWVAGPPHHEL